MSFQNVNMYGTLFTKLALERASAGGYKLAVPPGPDEVSRQNGFSGFNSFYREHW